nr:hypothetical protein CFP56_79638 [Quercus suber]
MKWMERSEQIVHIVSLVGAMANPSVTLRALDHDDNMDEDLGDTYSPLPRSQHYYACDGDSNDADPRTPCALPAAQIECSICNLTLLPTLYLCSITAYRPPLRFHLIATSSYDSAESLLQRPSLHTFQPAWARRALPFPSSRTPSLPHLCAQIITLSPSHILHALRPSFPVASLVVLA